MSDIYQYILDNYAYFRTRGPGWRNSIRHNLSLNDCFIKAGRSANGKGHYWAIHPANVDDFKKGDFRRRKAQRKVRKHMGLAVDEEDSPTPPPSPVTWAALSSGGGGVHHHPHHHPMEIVIQQHPHHHHRTMMEHHHSLLMMAAAAGALPAAPMTQPAPVSAGIPRRKRLFDVASLLGPDHHQTEPLDDERASNSSGGMMSPSSAEKRVKLEFADEEVDVVSEDSTEEDRHDSSPPVPTEKLLLPPPTAGWIRPAVAVHPGAILPQHPRHPAYLFQPHLMAAAAVQAGNNNMEQLTKYYEQVAEMMRISSGAAAGSSSAPSGGSGKVFKN